MPLHSGLGPFRNEWLTLEELFDARGLGNPQLVVLSACSTGLYDTRELPSEFIGLPNAFLQLGATAVIATLWPIDDVMTSLLIGRFYEEYMGHGKPTCSALRAAQLWLRDLQVEELERVVEKWGSEKRLTSENVPKVQQAIDDWTALNPTSSARTAYWGGFVHFGA
jgi:CHAT domain-containing protein